MYVKLRTQRSSPSRLNGVAPKNRIGTSLVRKKWRTSEMFFNRRRGCPPPEAKAASVPTLTSRGVGESFADRGSVSPPLRADVFAGFGAVSPPLRADVLVGVALLPDVLVADVSVGVAFLVADAFVAVALVAVAFLVAALVVRFAGADLPPAVFVVAFEGLLARTGRSVMARTSL